MGGSGKHRQSCTVERYMHPTIRVLSAISLCCACSSGSSEPVSAPQGVDGGVDGSSRETPNPSPSDAGPASVEAGPADAAISLDATQAVTYGRKPVAFDELASGTVVEGQYAQWLRLSTDAGCNLSAASDAGVAASQPNYIWTYYSCANGASASINMAFVKPVQRVSFKLVGVNSGATVATARVYRKDGTHADHPVVGKGSYLTPVLVTLAETDVTKVELVNISDAFGLGLDDLGFEFPER
jgi:hypothetical protein